MGTTLHLGACKQHFVGTADFTQSVKYFPILEVPTEAADAIIAAEDSVQAYKDYIRDNNGESTAVDYHLFQLDEWIDQMTYAGLDINLEMW